MVSKVSPQIAELIQVLDESSFMAGAKDGNNDEEYAKADEARDNLEAAIAKLEAERDSLYACKPMLDECEADREIDRKRIAELQAENEGIYAERDHYRVTVAQQQAHIAVMEAERRPIPFSEREPEPGQDLWVFWHGTGQWTPYRFWGDEYSRREARYGHCTHWLPMPPAPESET